MQAKRQHPYASPVRCPIRNYYTVCLDTRAPGVATGESEFHRDLQRSVRVVPAWWCMRTVVELSSAQNSVKSRTHSRMPLSRYSADHFCEQIHQSHAIHRSTPCTQLLLISHEILGSRAAQVRRGTRNSDLEGN